MTAQIIYLDQFAIARSHITSGNPTIREAAADVLAASTDPHDAWLVYQARRATWRREIREPLPHFADLRDGALLQSHQITLGRVLAISATCIVAAVLGTLALEWIETLAAWSLAK